MSRPASLTDRQLKYVNAAGSALPEALRQNFMARVADGLPRAPTDEAVQRAVAPALDVAHVFLRS
jgi:hypothetical protein